MKTLIIPKQHKKLRLTSFQIILFGFLLLIFIGGLLLMLPVASKDTGSTSFLDALFTSTSAVCVTGLVVKDTATYWSGFGQTVILLLIQIGGLGVITVSVAVTILSGKKIGLMERSLMQEAISAPKVGGIVRLTGFILKVTFLFELLGALLLSPVFCKEFGLGRGIWYALFHSVSAFCNAGFDLMGIKAPFSSLTAYSAQPLVNLVLLFLIVLGGIGFLTWEDIRTHRLHFNKYRMQTKAILIVTAFLILLPAVYFYFGEFTNLPVKERLLASLFQAVTPRTAGFNTVDLTSVSETGQIITVLLMLTGGAPGSTAGGMKVTTLAVLFAACIAVFRRRDSAKCFGRRIADDTIRHAAAILLLYLALFLSFGLIISRIEGLPVITCLFETASAVGTAGLTLGITTGLSVISRLLLMILMLFGRVGGLTLIFAALKDVSDGGSKLPLEKITVG